MNSQFACEFQREEQTFMWSLRNTDSEKVLFVFDVRFDCESFTIL